MAPPVTYQLDGVQYVSVLAGWGGPDGLGNDPSWGPVKPGYGRLLTFKLGGDAKLEVPAYGHKGPPPAPTIKADASPQVVHQGKILFGANCAGCHGDDAIAGPLPVRSRPWRARMTKMRSGGRRCARDDEEALRMTGSSNKEASTITRARRSEKLQHAIIDVVEDE